jgi:hypothetical protein
MILFKYMKKIFFSLIAFTLLLSPLSFVFAQAPPPAGRPPAARNVPAAQPLKESAGMPKPDGTINGLFGMILYILNGVIYIVMGLALVTFLIGTYRYVVAGGMEDKEKAKSQIMWGIIGLFVMVSVWAIVGLFSGSLFGSQPVNAPQRLPTINR